MKNGKPQPGGDRFPDFNHAEKEAEILKEFDALENPPPTSDAPASSAPASASAPAPAEPVGPSSSATPDAAPKAASTDVSPAADPPSRQDKPRARKTGVNLKAVSNPVPAAEENALAKIRAKSKGLREYLMSKQAAAMRTAAQLLKQRNRLESIMFWTDPFIVDPARRKAMQKWAVWTFWIMILLVCSLMGLENHASASLLINNAALGFTSAWNAKIFLATVALGGFVLGFALKLLPPTLRGPANLILTLVFAASLCVFALSTGLATGQAMGANVPFTENSEANQFETAQPSHIPTEWIVLASILFLNVTSGAIAKLSLSLFWASYDCYDNNPRYQRAATELELVEQQYQAVQDVVAEVVCRMSYLDQLEQEAIAAARAELRRSDKK